MGLLLTPPVVARYNVLFQFLMRLKRVQLRLEGAWQKLHVLYTRGGCEAAGGDDGGGGGGNGEGRSRVQQLYLLRHHMAHLVSNLQIYIQVRVPSPGARLILCAATFPPSPHPPLSPRARAQVDVIESNYAALSERIAGAHDFAEAERAHANYQHALVNQCFLNTVTITRAIGAVFKQAQQLCGMVDAYAHVRGAGRPPHEALPALVELPVVHTSFHTSVNQLYTYLQSSRLQDANKAPHLRQLFMRLNFNNYVGGRVIQRVMAHE
eukprot:360147-Chlamydomonas_euryale.AAC.4